MPEGDTIFRTARTLRAALSGQPVTDFWTNVGQVRSLGPRRLVGQTVAAVEPRGKHLLHWFEPSGLALHTHMRMSGSWHLYRDGERWRRPRPQARVILGVEGWVAVCFNAPVVELLGRAQVERHPSLAALGPDALDPETDLVEARRRLDERRGWTIGEALLDQRVLAGVGNVYKCEVLFLHGVDPWTPVEHVSADDRDHLLRTAERLLKINAASRSFQRRTAEGAAEGRGDALSVYGKAGRPCPRCGAGIRLARQGEQARPTYWCPSCQGAGKANGAARSRRHPQSGT